MNPLLIRRRGMMQAAEVVDTYLTFTALADNSSVKLTAVGSAPAVSLEYNTGGGWSPYTVGDTISLNDGDSVKMRGVNTTFGTSTTNYHNFVMTGSIDASGDIISLINGFGGDVALRNFCFISMFQGCTSLVSAPSLPATTMATDCYRSMFQGCTSLVSAPSLPATTMATNCYNSMFRGCTSLVSAPSLPANTMANNCYNSMFRGCTSLVSAPSLPANTMAGGCYNSMFYGCTHITSHQVATLNNSSGNVFFNNSACISFTIDADTPPTIGNSTITGLKSDCIIYVPAGSVAAYQAAQYWSARASYIQAQP